MLTYDDAKNLMRSARKGVRKLANNTYLVQSGEDYAVRLHSTNVVTIHEDGTYTLHSGGWMTVTTKARMNVYSPASVSQKDFAWYLCGKLFQDGVRVDSTGKPV